MEVRDLIVVVAVAGTAEAFIVPLEPVMAESGLIPHYFVGDGNVGGTGAPTILLGKFRRSGPFTVIRVARDFRRQIRTFDRPVVLAATPYALTISRLALIGSRTPLVGAVHGSLLEAKLLQRLVFVAMEAILARRDDVTVTLNRKDLRFYRWVRWPRPALMAPVGGAGISESRIPLPPLVPDPVSPPAIGYIGRLTASKGLDLLVEAYRIVRHTRPDVELRLVGAVESGESAWQPPADLPVTLVGHTSDVASELRKMSVFCLCSRREGFPMGLTEALAMNVPAVAVSNSGTRRVAEVFGDRVTVTADNPGEVAAAILSKLDADPRDPSPDIRDSVSEARVHEFYRALFSTVLDRRRSPKV